MPTTPVQSARRTSSSSTHPDALGLAGEAGVERATGAMLFEERNEIAADVVVGAMDLEPDGDHGSAGHGGLMKGNRAASLQGRAGLGGGSLSSSSSSRRNRSAKNSSVVGTMPSSSPVKLILSS